MATGDVKAAVDDADPANLATLPVVDADYTKRIKVSLSAAEMNGDRVTVIFSDVSGAAWCDLTIDIATVTNQFDSLATAAALTVVDDFLDTEMAAVLAAVDTEVAALVTSVGLLPTAAAIAAAVWANATRTLSSYGTLIADIWANATRTLTQTAAQVAASVSGSDLIIVRAVTFAPGELTGLTIPATWSKVYFTVKRSAGQPDSDALIQIVKTNGGAAGDGLKYLNGAVAATAGQASLTVDQALGTVLLTITDDATAALSGVFSGYGYDLKAVASDSTSVLLTSGAMTVTSTPTEAIV